MKKFLVYLLAIVLVVSMGFAVFYLVRDDEVLSITNTSLYKEVGDDINIGLNTKKVNSYTKINLLYSGDTESVREISKNLNPGKGEVKASLQAISGGSVRINFQTNNSKFRNLYCDVLIGDGSVANPYYIDSAEKLFAIGRNISEYPNYTADKCYELICDIDLGFYGTGYWQPISNFSGHFQGNGYTIKNMVIDSSQLVDQTSATRNLGLFGTLDANASIENVVFDGVRIINGSSASVTATNIGAVVGVNHGTIKRVDVKNVQISNNDGNANVGGAVGVNNSALLADGTMATGRIDRVAVNGTFNYTMEEEATREVTVSGIYGNVGGIAGSNIGGTIINSYSKGDALICTSDMTRFGGITVYNTTANFGGKYKGANIKDCYSAISVTGVDAGEYSVSGVLVGNTNVSYTDPISGVSANYNNIIGNYYDMSMTAIDNFPESSTITTYTATEDYEVTGLRVSTMNNRENYVSSREFEYKKNSETGAIERVYTGNLIYWNFDNVWAMGTMPYLTFANVEVSDGFETTTAFKEVNSEDMLRGIATDADRNNTMYFISNDIILDAESEWTPIGTVEDPFLGSIVVGKDINGEYFKISNINVTQNTYDYAGFVGVMAHPAHVEGLTLRYVNIKAVDDHDYVGAIVGSNGYQIGTKQVSGGTVENCAVLGATLQADIAVGGIAGANINGKISNVKVQSFEASDTHNGNIDICINAPKKGYIGGLVGNNTGSIAGGVEFSAVTGNVTIHQSNHAYVISNVSIGGVAGANTGSISACAVAINHAAQGETAATNYGIFASNGQLYGGGVAGTNTGIISGCYVRANVNVKGMVGGIAGMITGDANGRSASTITEYSKYYNIYSCVVDNCTISGTNVGGLAGSVKIDNTKLLVTAKSGWDLFIGKGGLYELYKIDTQKMKEQGTVIFASIVNSKVTSSVTLSGSYTGGLAYELVSGVISDCSVEATFAGSNNAGFAYTITRNPSTNEAGLIERCYGVFSFSSGTNYQVSSSQVHASPTGLFGAPDYNAKTAGFALDYRFQVKAGKAKAPSYSHSWHNNSTLADADEMINSKTWEDLGWKQASWRLEDIAGAYSYWSVSNGKLPVLTGLPSFN